eukprot:2024766-Alexandrium_andersonii.AAC.1
MEGELAALKAQFNASLTSLKVAIDKVFALPDAHQKRFESEVAIAVSRKDFLATVMGNDSATLMEAARSFQPSMGLAAGGKVAAPCRSFAHLK